MENFDCETVKNKLNEVGTLEFSALKTYLGKRNKIISIKKQTSTLPETIKIKKPTFEGFTISAENMLFISQRVVQSKNSFSLILQKTVLIFSRTTIKTL
jgi:hypothetical protein